MLAGPIVQIAGIRDQDEAWMLCDSGVTHLGFPLRLDHHREDLSEQDARKIIRGLPTDVGAVLITYLTEAREILDFVAYLGTNWVQLHGAISRQEVARLRQEGHHAALPLIIIRSLIVGRSPEEELVRTARSVADLSDVFLTDTYDPQSGASGATGKTHDWQTSRRLVIGSGRPVILAGGLTPDNVREAIQTVRPAGVDSHTGVEGPDGRKDRGMVEAFLKEAHQAFAETAEG
jgi:phosphoribosylanthranilate isomerase